MIFGYMGREDFVDNKGHTWRPATEFVSRTGYGTDVVDLLLWTKRRTMYIGNTNDPEIYRYGAHGDKFWTNVTVGPGKYDVRLHFASTPLHPFLEQDKDGGWKRYVLNVDINGKRKIEAMDVAKEAGGTFLALTRTFKDIEPVHGIIEVVVTGVDGREAVLQALEIIPVEN
jgi:Malectin domain